VQVRRITRLVGARVAQGGDVLWVDGDDLGVAS
jgi:hypothetical protein